MLSYSPVGLCLLLGTFPFAFFLANDGFGIANVVNCPMEVSIRTLRD